MVLKTSFMNYSVEHPKTVTLLMIVLALLFAAAVALPSLWPDRFTFLHGVKVDTDPENMLPHDEPVRVYHDAMKEEMALHDVVVLGIVNDHHPDGVFNPKSLKRIYELTEFSKTLTWPDKERPGKQAGVIEVDLIAPSLVDNIEHRDGVIKFEWLMPRPPETLEECKEIQRKAERLPFLQGTLVSEDGKALCLYLPITSKDVSYRIYKQLNEKISTFEGDEEYYITGLPVAEDTFGVEMFKQMAVSAPVAMMIIFLLMFFFFRKFVLVISPMIVAMVSVIVTMGLLVATGNTVHIMSSMIPIFIMPIAVLDAVHILSDFFDRYQETKDRKKTIISVMETLFQPMLYTSLTTTAGFASLALTPIPPVQIFGLFVAFGVLNAWFWTIVFIPAFIMLMPEKSLENFGHVAGHDKESKSPITRFLRWSGVVTFNYAKLVIVATVLLTVVAVYGISKIRINDNPIKWFKSSHPIRVADKVLNEHFGGTYMGYLAFEAEEEGRDPSVYAKELAGRMPERAKEVEDFVDSAPEVFEALKNEAMRVKASSVPELLDKLYAFTVEQSDKNEDLSYTWDEAGLFIDEERVKAHVFKQPEVLEYLAGVQEGLLTTGSVGKANSLPDLVKTVHRELVSGEDDQFKIPATARGVAECLMQFQNSHRPNDLWHFVTPDFRKCVFWIQLQTGDNMDMAKVVEDLDRYVEQNPPPLPMTHKWFGLTYINVVWQDKMVSGMLEAFLGSFLIVFFMMTVIFRSALWGFMSMIPLTVTIGLIYGVIGLVGKDYDMPVAVLSSLSLGLAVDYAIHFLARSRMLRESHGSWVKAAGPVFGEPARAIARNVVVVGFGFLPLLAAPLVPYKTVGTFIAAILFAAGVASLLILPSMIRLLERRLFPDTGVNTFTCKCGTCALAGASIVLLIAVNVHQFAHIGWNILIWPSIVAILIISAICFFMGRSKRCRIDEGVSK